MLKFLLKNYVQIKKKIVQIVVQKLCSNENKKFIFRRIDKSISTKKN